MQDNNNNLNKETREWLYKSLSDKGYNLGTYEDFDRHADDEDTRKWLYDAGVKSGLELGSYDDFSKGMTSSNGEGTVARQVINEYDASVARENENRTPDNTSRQTSEETKRQIIANKPDMFKRDTRSLLDKGAGVRPTDTPQFSVGGVMQRIDNDIAQRSNYVDKAREEQAMNNNPSVWEALRKGIGAGVTRAGAGLLDAMHSLSSGMIVENPASPTGYSRTQKYEEALADKTNPLTVASDAMNRYAEQLSTEAQPYGGKKGFLDLMWDGDWENFFKKGLATAGESLPMTLSAFNPYTATINAISMAGGNFRQNTLDNPDIPEWKRAAQAIGSAAIEQAVEKYADPIFKYIGGGKLTGEAAKEIADKVTQEAAGTLANRIFNGLKNIAKDAAGEGAEEVISNFGNDLLGETLDLVGGGTDYGLRAQWEQTKEENPDADLWEFAKAKAKENVESFIGGALAGAYTSGSVQVPAMAAQEIARANARRQETEDRIARETRDILANSDQETGTYTECVRYVTNDVGERVEVPGYIVGHMGGRPLWKPEGADDTVEAIPLKDGEYDPASIKSMPTQEVIDETAQAIREDAEEQARREEEAVQRESIGEPVKEEKFTVGGITYEADHKDTDYWWMFNLYDAEGNLLASNKPIPEEEYRQLRLQEQREAHEANVRSVDEGNNGAENIPASSETLQAGASGASALERIPKDEQGQPLYEQADPETAWDAITEQTGGDEEMVGEVVADLVEEQERALKAAERELKKLQEGKPQQKKGDAPLTMEERISAKKAAKEQLGQAQANVDAAQKRLAAWQRIAQTPQRRKQAALAEQSRVAEEAARLRREQEEQERAEREEAERMRREALNGVPDFVEDTPQDARARGYRRMNGNKVDRQQAIPTRLGNEVQVKFDDNNIPTGHVALIDASQLQPSHTGGQRNPLHFIDEAQPKERNDKASVMSARKIAANIRPEEITSSVTAYTGAPTVNSRGEVIQGNNRSAALREMWAEHPEQAAKYRQYLTEHAADFGLAPEDVESMQQPVLVNMLDVTDDEAITLGQFVAQDTESGGTERIKPKNIVQKMGGDMRSFANQLLASPDEEMSFAELVDHNGFGVLKWMQQKGYITPTQYKSAFDSKGGLTAEAKNDLKGVMYQSIFQNGNTHLEEMFNALPAKAQKAILATAYRDYDSPNAERMIEEIQNSINAYYALSQDPAFANAKNYKEARIAAEVWKRQLAFDDVTGESYLPSERYSNFALLLATMYKGQTQTFIQNTFTHIFDLVQGTQETTLFDEPDNTPRTLVDAINETLGNLREELLLNGNFTYNGQQRSNVLAGGSAAGQQGRQGSDGSAPAGGRNEDAARADDGSGRTRISDEQGQTEGNDNSQSEGNSTPKQEKYTLSSKRSGNGEPFYQDGIGNIDLVDIPQEVFDEIGYSKAPFRLTPSMILHVLNGHGEELGVSTVEETVHFVLDVMTHFDHVRLGYDGALIFSIENGRKRIGKRAVTILINSDNGKFYGLKTSGYETVTGLSKRPLLWERGAKEVSSTTDAASVSVPTGKSPLSGEQSGSASHQSKSLSNVSKHTSPEGGTSSISHADNAAPAISLQSRGDEKDDILQTAASKPHGNTTSSVRKDTDKSSVTQTIGEKVAKAEEETDTNPTEAQKEAGNYKKGHVRIGQFDITVENPKGSVRRGVDASGKAWEQTMRNTYGYIRGTEGVDGDHIDVFLTNDIDGWNGRQTCLYR